MSAALDSAAFTNPTGNPIIKAGRAWPSLINSIRRSKAVGAFPTTCLLLYDKFDKTHQSRRRITDDVDAALHIPKCHVHRYPGPGVTAGFSPAVNRWIIHEADGGSAELVQFLFADTDPGHIGIGNNRFTAANGIQT